MRRFRFVEIHFEELGSEEVEVVIERKCGVPKKMAKDMVKVMTLLQLKRKASEAFKGKRGFITLRDLFKWAQRYTKFTPPEGDNKVGYYSAYSGHLGPYIRTVYVTPWA